MTLEQKLDAIVTKYRDDATDDGDSGFYLPYTTHHNMMLMVTEAYQLGLSNAALESVAPHKEKP